MGMGTLPRRLPAIRIGIVEESSDYSVHDVLQRRERVILLYLKISGDAMVTGPLQGGAQLGILQIWIWIYDDFTTFKKNPTIVLPVPEFYWIFQGFKVCVTRVEGNLGSA